MAAPEAGHDGGLAVQGARFIVDALDIDIVGAGEYQMVVACEHDVDAIDGGELERGVFGARDVLTTGNAGMGERDDDVGALFLHHRDIGLGGFDDVAGHDLADQMGGVPGHDLGRQEPDQADLDGLGRARTVGQFLFDDAEGLEIGLVGQRVLAQGFALDQIGRNEGEIGAGERGVEIFEAIIEFVIAQGGGFIAQRVHCGDHRVDIAVKALFVGDVIAHRVALDDVAIVDQHRIARFGADGIDDGGGAGEAHRIVGGVGIIIIGENGDVQVGRFHDAQMGLVGLGAGGKGMQGGHGTDADRAGEKCTAGYLGIEFHRDSPEQSNGLDGRHGTIIGDTGYVRRV